MLNTGSYIDCHVHVNLVRDSGDVRGGLAIGAVLEMRCVHNRTMCKMNKTMMCTRCNFPTFNTNKDLPPGPMGSLLTIHY